MLRILYHPNLHKSIETTSKIAKEHVRNTSSVSQIWILSTSRSSGCTVARKIVINTIRQWEIKLQNNKTRKCHAPTMSNTVTNLVEMQQVNSTSAQDTVNAFDKDWLFKYPRQVQILIHDQGTEFLGPDNFHSLLRQWGIDKTYYMG